MSAALASAHPGGGEEFVQSADRVAHDPVVDVVEVIVRVGAHGLGALQEGQGHGAGFAATGASHEEVILAVMPSSA